MTDAAQPPVFTDNPRNTLEVALYEGMADQTRMGLFERLMLESDLFAVAEAGGAGGTPGDDGAKVLREGEQMILRGVVLNDGRNTVAVFTDPTRIVGLFGQDVRIVAMKGRALMNIVQNMPVLLNPDGGRGLLMEPDQIKSLLEHPVMNARRPTGSVVLSAIPEMNQPVPLILKLRELLATRKVQAAWLGRAQWMEEGLMGWFLDVRTDEPADEIRALAERVASGIDFNGEVFDISIAKPGGEDGVGAQLV